jgi:hypothetical protein
LVAGNNGLIEGWLVAEPQLTAIAIVGRLAELHPDQFGKKQHSIVQRLLRALRKSAAHRLIAAATAEGHENGGQPPGAVDGSGYEKSQFRAQHDSLSLSLRS